MALACTKTEVTTNSKCFRAAVFGTHGQKALESYLWTAIMDSFQGTTYVSDPNALYKLVCAYIGSMTDDQLEAAYISILNVAMPNTVVINSTAVSKTALTAAQAATGIKCWRHFNERQLKEIKVYALCYIFGYMGF